MFENKTYFCRFQAHFKWYSLNYVIRYILLRLRNISQQLYFVILNELIFFTLQCLEEHKPDKIKNENVFVAK